MEPTLERMAKRLETLEASLGQYKDDWLQWRQLQDQRNVFHNTSIATIRDTLVGMGDALLVKNRKTLSVREAARYAKVECATVRRWLNDGRLKGSKVGQNKQSRWRVSRSDLERFLERMTNSPE